jgi:ABC-2 type transport system ATP-binding protein
MFATQDSVRSPLALHLDGASKKYKHFELKNVSISIPQGAVAGLIGPNGSAKTSTMRIIMGSITPHHGSVNVLGQTIWPNEKGEKEDVGYIFR